MTTGSAERSRSVDQVRGVVGGQDGGVGEEEEMMKRDMIRMGGHGGGDRN